MSYILILVWLALTSAMAKSGGMRRRELVLGKEERRATWTYALLLMAPIMVMAGMRSVYFGDTLAYVRSYQSIPGNLQGKWDYAMVRYQKDHGFYLFGAFISIFLGDHERIYLLILAFLQGICLAKTYRKYSTDYWLAIFIFVATTDIYSWMYNGIRQFTAVAITFAAAGLVFRRKYVKACLVMAFASLFHQSALMMIPIIFIVQGKPWNWKTLLVIAGTVLVMAFSGVFTDTLDTVLADTQYRNVVSDWRYGQDDGTNPLRVLVYSVPTILSIFCRKKIQKSGDRAVQVACNMGIISTALYLVSMVTSGIYIGRLPIYCTLYANGILLPWEFKYVYGKNLKYVAMLCYLLFYFIQLLMWGII